jgi:hypothetical protein
MSKSTADAAPQIIPARLSFLSIYNPELGKTDETFENQIVFHYSRAARAKRKTGGHDKTLDRSAKDEENEMLRQIGLAQGMVNFAKYGLLCFFATRSLNRKLRVSQELFRWAED